MPNLRPGTWVFVLVLMAGLYAWDRWGGNDAALEKPAAASKSHQDQPRAKKSSTQSKSGASTTAGEHSTGNWRKLDRPRLIENGGNDGDSFFIAHDGGEERYRLYFVDTPETTRRYPDRLGHQARYFGRISFDNLIAGGKEAKEFTLEQLRRHPIEVWTKGERVMDSDRLHALVRFPSQPGQPWLHEELVKAGLARIYTLPANLPDGTPKEKHLLQLKDLETGARREKRGLWGD